MTLVLGALDAEIAEITREMDDVRAESWCGFSVRVGRAGGHEVAVARSGVGKSLSALLCQHRVDTIHPDRIIVTGLAGALTPDLSIGDTVVARDCLQHDMDATAFGFAPGEIPYSPFRILECDRKMVDIAATIEPLDGAARVGRILTGDQFITDAAVRDCLHRELDADAVEMEGASVAVVAAVNEVPFLLIRTISDLADGTAPHDFAELVTYASRNSYHYLTSILDRL